jgi:hypothetical protein
MIITNESRLKRSRIWEERPRTKDIGIDLRNVTESELEGEDSNRVKEGSNKQLDMS